MAPRPLSVDASLPFSDRSDQDYKQTIMKSAFAKKSPKETIISCGYNSSPEVGPTRNNHHGRNYDQSDRLNSSGNTSLSAFSNKMTPLHIQAGVHS